MAEEIYGHIVTLARYRRDGTLSLEESWVTGSLALYYIALKSSEENKYHTVIHSIPVTKFEFDLMVEKLDK